MIRPPPSSPPFPSTPLFRSPPPPRSTRPQAPAASGAPPSRQARPQPVPRGRRDIPVLDVREGVEPPHLGGRDAARELIEGRGHSRVPCDRCLADHRRSFVRRGGIAGARPKQL